jgi:hypothetical protein
LLLDTKEAAKILGVKPDRLKVWRTKGTGPRWHRIGPKLIRYNLKDLEEFIRDSVEDVPNAFY